MSTETASDVSPVQDEELLRKMWQETEDFGKKKDIRSHMYKIREARLKDFYGTGEEIATSSETRQHSATTTSKTSSGTTGTKVSDLMTHADNLADHSFLSLKSKEIRDSESPTKDSYKITETRKIDDRDWNVVECNEATRDGKTHTTSRIATTSGKQQLDDGELNYAAKSEQKATVYKDGDEKNFTKSVGASSQNVIKQEAFGGDENNKFHSSSTTTSSSSKFTTEKRSTTSDVAEHDSPSIKSSRQISARDFDDPLVKVTSSRPTSDSTVNTAETVVRKVYTENVPNEFKNHPNYIDGKTKVTTETKTLPDGSTITSTRYETKGATQYSTSSASSTTSSSAKHVSSNEQTSSNLTRTAVTTDDTGRNFDGRNISKINDNVTGNDSAEVVRNQRVQSKFVIDANDISRTVKNQLFENRSVNESDVKRTLAERDTMNVQDYDVVVKLHDVTEPETQTVTRITRIIESTYDDKPIKDKNDTTSTVTTVKSYAIPSEESQITTTVHKRVSSQYDKQQLASDDFLNTERVHVVETKNIKPVVTKNEPVCEGIEPIKQIISEAPAHFVEIEFIPNKEKKAEPKYKQPERRHPIKPDKSELDVKVSPTVGQYETTYRSDYVPRRISVEVSPTHDAFARSLRSMSPDRISKTGSIKSLRTTSSTSLRSTNSPDRSAGKPGRTSPVISRPLSPTKKSSKSPEKQITTEFVKNKRHESPGKKFPVTSQKPSDNYLVNVEITTNSGKSSSQLVNTDTVTRRKKITNVQTEIDSNTLTRKKEITESTRSRSVSPTSTASDIEFIRHRTDVVTDLDIDEPNKRFVDKTELNRKDTEDFDERTCKVTTVKKSQKISDKSATTPLINFPTKESTEITNKNKPKSIRRTDTYEERCKEILGISDATDIHRKPSLPNVGRGTPQSPTKSTKTIETSPVKPRDVPTDTPKSSPEKELPSKIRKSLEKELVETLTQKQAATEKVANVQEFATFQTRKIPAKEFSPEKPRVTQQIPSVQEFPSQIRKTPTKEPLEPSPAKHKDIKQTPTVQEFPSQIRKTPAKEPLERYPEKPEDAKQTPIVQEFPSQLRKIPTKESVEPYSEKPKDTKRTSSIQEFPSQIRKMPTKEPLEPHPEKPKGVKQTSSVQEFPSQIRKTPSKEPLEPYPEKPKDIKQTPLVQEFPSQLRKTPTKEPLEPSSEKPKGTKRTPSVQEFPSQTRKSPTKEPLKAYPEKPKDTKQTPSVEELPYQIRKTPTRESIEPYSEKPKDTKQTSSIQEFPSQIRKTPTKEPLVPSSQKPKDTKRTPSIQEFPSQTRKSPTKEPFKAYPEKPKDTKQTPSVEEFPYQIRKTPTKEPIEPYSEKPKDTKRTSSVQEFPSQIRKTPTKEPLVPFSEKPKDTKRTPSIQEFPSHIRKTMTEDSLKSLPEKIKDTKGTPSVQEFPSQIQKTPTKEPLEPYPEKTKDTKQTPSVQEFPPQIRKSQVEEPLEPYLGKPKDTKQISSAEEFLSHITKIPSKEFLESYPGMLEDIKETPVCESPAQVRKTPTKIPLETDQRKPKDTKQIISLQEQSDQIRRTVENKQSQVKSLQVNQTSEPFTGRSSVTKEIPLVITEKEPSEACSEKPKASKKTPSEPDKQPSVARPEKIKSSKQIPVVVKKSPEGVSLDDIPAVKPDTVSLDDIRLVKKAEKSLENIVLNNVEHKFDQPVDEFILSEKEDTEITLRRYKDNTIQLPRGIPDIQSDVKSSKRIKSKVVEKTKKERTTVVEDTSSTSEEEEDEILHIEDQIIEDICDVVECIDKEVTEKEVIEKITETGEKHRLRPEKSEPKIEKKQTPVAKTPNKIKSKPQKDLVPVDDFVTVTKIQLLQSKSKTPVEEPIQTKKFISTLCKEEEEENVVRSRVTLTKGKPNEHLSKPKLDRKTTPTGKSPTKKRQTELFLKKEKQDVNVKAKTTEMKPVSKERVKRIPEQKKISVITKTTDDKKIYTTEYTDEYCITTKDRKTVKPTSNVTTKITLTPTKQTQIKKTIIQDSSIARDVEKVQKIVNGTPSKPRVEKRRPIPKKPEDQPARQSVKPKTTETKQAAAITKTTSQKTVEIQPARRHVVSTVINIKPKIKPETVTRTIHKTTVTKTITAPKTTPKDSKPKPKRIQNGHIFTDDEESDIEIVREDEDVHIKETLKPVRDHITPSRKSPITKPIDSRKKCITTKSILIENAVADQREIIVDLKRSKSSREGTPDRICPYPISSDVDLGVPRYPDRVVEPDDGSFYPKPTRISDIPLNETENVINFDRITEIKEDILKREKTDIEEDTDECLLSVNEKVSKFLSTAEQVTKKPADMKPAPKVERPKLEVDDSLKQDECLLSVSDKVQRFINTAEQLAVGTKETFQRSRSPKYRDVKSKIDDDDHLKPKEKVTPSAFTSQPQEPETIEREQRPLLRKSLSPEKKEYSPRPASRDSRSPNQFDSSSPKYRTPERKSSDLHTRKTTEEIMRIRKESFDDDSTPKTSRRQSKDEPKTILSPTGRLRSTETIKKAKALFENMGRKEDTVKQRDILNRPSVFEGRKLIKTETSEEKTHRDVRTRLTYDEVRKSPSPDKPRTKVKSDYEVPTEEIPHYMTPLDRTLKEHKKMKETDIEGDVESIDSVPSRETSLDRDVPHYMLPLDRTVRERSPYKENLKQLEDIMYKSTGTIHSEEVDVKTTKFGVTLRRTDSGRMITSGRKLSTSSVDQQTTDLEIEEIYDLEYLEKLLETIVGYDIRRRIRAQIRIIKRAIDENTFEVLIRKSSSPPKDRPKRPAEKIEQSKRYLATDKKKHIEESVSQHDTHITETSEYRSSYNKSRRSPVKSPSPSGGRKAPSPKRSKDKSFSPDRKSSIVETDSVETRKVATMTTTRIFQTDLRKTKPASKTVAEEKPEWITQRPLRKVSDTSSPMKKIVTTTTKKAIGSKESEDVKPIDAITSGYGVGPTDENGAPLFGLKALRSQNKSEKTKVQGTVIRSHYYSEDGGEPEGEISITKFSTDPDDLEAKTVTQGSGISSVTTTQKFGYKGTPSLKTITTKTKKTSGGDAEYRSTEKTSKVTRRGSVKEISQKFIENAVDTLKSERQSSYPKAGLILRTSSFKDAASNGTDSSREGSPATQEVHQKIFRSVKTTGTTSDDKKTETFLTNKSKVTDVQDVISRMKSKGTYVEETEEDAEARNLLNKFIGSQVLLSGMESSHGTKPIAATRSTKITTTTTSSESSKPTTVTRTFTHPITAELLETVWDEQTLKLLLEQSTDYEDRRIIRARLREVMAEQEACAELVEKASDEAAMKESGSTVHEGADVQDSETDDDVSTVKTTIRNEAELQHPQQLQPQPQPDLIMQTNPIYNRPNEQENISDVDEYPIHLNEKANRFNNKKLKMKRANTIDIPKPLKYYECDEEDSENEEVNNRRNSYLALRGPIRVGRLNMEKKVPDFEPKTESDRKFVAFLDKHGESNSNNDTTNKTSMWCNQQQTKNTNNWSSKFGNLKNNFEKVQASGSISSARNFWKSADDAVTAGRISHIGPKISRQSARNLQQMFEEKQKQSQQNTTILSSESNVVTGSLKVDTKSNKNIKVMTQPNAINKFSHAPMSAFKPVAKKIEPSFLKPKALNVTDASRRSQVIENKSDDKTPESPLYLYSPKQFSPRNSSPVSFTPWNAGRTGESRVLSIVASKFENGAREKSDTNIFPQRRMSSEKITIPQGLIQQQNQPHEKLSAPYLVKSVSQNSSVKKLSGQYDNMGGREVYTAFNSRERHDMKPRVFVPGENYTIQYNNPVLPKPQPRVYNAEYTITQQHYNIPRQNDDEFVRGNKSNVKQFKSTEQVYDRVHIQNDQCPTYQAQLHNQQQQLYSKTQQEPCKQAPVDRPHLVIQPEVYNEPAKSNDECQYTSSYQFRPQSREIPDPVFNRDRSVEIVDDFNTDTPKTWQHEYYTRLPTDLELDETKETKSSSSVPNNSQQCYESGSSVKPLSFDRQTSHESVKEYTPVSSKVMSGPISQQAVTVQQNSPKNRDQHDMEFNLKATLQKFSSQMEVKEQQRKSPNYQKSPKLRRASLERKNSLKEDVAPPLVVYNNVKRPSLCVNDQPLSLESLEINERGESVLSSKFHIPVRKTGSSPPTSKSELSKSESWHQICQNTQSTSKPSPRASPNTRSISRSKSSHTLAVPKQFEAGMTKSEMAEKRKTMEAYFSASKPLSKSEIKKTSINRVKTSQKVSTQRQNSTGLCRSKTLPDIVCLDKLDDSNIDAIFEDLFNARTTTGTHTEGPVTATSQVTTRITTQQVKKPMSPFAKFRQLDKQNSLNSPPSTPKSPTGGGPLFKFTDPSLNQSANTVKQRLLQWCQMKTKEYENIQLDNFSTSWADGMAFCALIHHFLPDAFDYKTLNPRNRRHNFTLAFQVADEKAGIAPLLDVDDMVAISRPDWKCVFTYVQSIYRRFKDEE